jgi:cell division protein FtsX
MKIRTLKRHFVEAFKSMGRNGWMSFASISAVTVTLLLVSVFLAILLNINHIASQMMYKSELILKEQRNPRTMMPIKNNLRILIR